MELSGMVFVQVLIIVLLMLVGYVLVKTKVIDDRTSKQMTNALFVVVVPAVLIKAYQKDFSTELVRGLLLSLLLAVVVHAIGILIAMLVFRKEETLKYRIKIFASVYSNCGFMAIPLLSATLGEDGVFYGSAYFAVFTILTWTHGICLYQGNLKAISGKKILTNAGIIGVTIALILFVFRIKLPYVLNETIGHLAALNTPLGMMLTGAYLTRVDFKKALKSLSLYGVSAMRLLIIPIITILLAKLMNLDPVAAKATIICAACPTASISALFAAKYDLDAGYATQLVSVTTLMSVATIPLILLIY